MSERTSSFNILIVGQAGRLAAEALLFAASLRAMDSGFQGRLFVAEPQPGRRWSFDPRMSETTHAALKRLDATIVPFKNRLFGQSYPYGNKIEALSVLPAGEPFVFFDTDTLITGPVSTVPFDFAHPSASMNVSGTWPKPSLYGPGMTEIWGALYQKFDLDFEGSLDTSQPDGHWRRYLYFNAGWFYGACPKIFGDRFAEYAGEIRRDPPKELIGQKMDPWLDQVALPLVIHSLGGKRNGVREGLLDGALSHHYRTLPLLYARAEDRVIETMETISEPNWIKKVLKEHDPFKRMIYQGKGRAVRALFDQQNLPKVEREIRQTIKKAGLWMR